MKFLFFFIITI